MLECNNKFRSLSFHMEEFAETVIWQDMLQELSNWENRIMEELASPTFDASTGKMLMGKEERTLYDEMLRGSLKAIDNMRQLPFIIQGIIEQQQVLKETDNDDQSNTDGTDEPELG